MGTLSPESLDLLGVIGKLKTTFRYSETIQGRKESVADHSFRVALMTLVYGDFLPDGGSRNRALRMALVHDIAEAITGDIDALRIWDGEMTKEEKRELEVEAMQKISDMLPEEMREDVLGCWEEYERKATEAARFVRALDKLETLLQLSERGYESFDRPEFIANYADAAVSDFPNLRPLLAEIKKRLRNEFIKGGIEWKESYDSCQETKTV